MKNTINNILKICTCVLLFTACEDFLAVNEDLNNPASTAPSNRLAGILANSATLVFNAAETGAYYTQHLATHSGTDITRDRWDYRTQTRVGIFRHHYFDVAGNAVGMITEAEKNRLDINYLGIGKILLAHSFLLTTDVLGDMPFTEAFTGKDSPKYDPQEVVYAGIGRLLDEGIQHLDDAIRAPAVRPITASSDPIFEGNLYAWKAFAHGLKARFLIHQTNVGVDLTKVIDQVDMALQNWETPLYPFSDTEESTVWTRNPWGPTAEKPLPYSMRVNELDRSAPSTFFMDQLKKGADMDPRVYKHFEPNAAGEIVAVESGVGRGAIPADDLPGMYNMALTKDGAPLEYMTEAELHFIKAEASFASDKSQAYNSYIDGIISDMERLEVSVMDQNSYLSNSVFVAQNADELTLSDIIIQKYIAMYLQPEAWVDMRRHGYDPEIYPGLTRPANVDETIFGEDNWIVRIPYNMETEYIYNLPEIERLGAKDPAFLAKKLWWMK